MEETKVEIGEKIMYKFLKQYLHKKIRVFLINNYHFFGSLKNVDEDFFVLEDDRSGEEMIIRISEVRRITCPDAREVRRI